MTSSSIGRAPFRLSGIGWGVVARQGVYPVEQMLGEVLAVVVVFEELLFAPCHEVSEGGAQGGEVGGGVHGGSPFGSGDVQCRRAGGRVGGRRQAVDSVSTVPLDGRLRQAEAGRDRGVGGLR